MFSRSIVLGSVLVVATLGLLAGMAWADIVVETVTVGNSGNTGELSGAGAGGDGPDRVCGAVDYVYNIGKYEVTAGQYAAFLNAVAAADIHGLYNTGMADTTYGSGISRGGSSGSYTYSVNAAFVNRPVNYVSYWDACRFSNWLHNGQPTGMQGEGTTETGAYTLDGYVGSDGRTIQRNTEWAWAVASEDEWYKAAYHRNDGVTGHYHDYPTSTDNVPGRHMADDSGNNANYYAIFVPYPIDPPYYTTSVGEFQNSDSPYGTFDQGGNVWEWNEGIPDSVSSRGLRGGSFDHHDYCLRGATRGFDNPNDELDHMGFRVVQIPEPATMWVLALGCMGLLRERKTVRG